MRLPPSQVHSAITKTMNPSAFPAIDP